jgi:hypothetical protein
MSHRDPRQLLTCPYCLFRSQDIDTLERHVQRSHADQQARLDNPSQPRQSEPAMSDADLAQLLAFEEAGLPAELALSERPNAPAPRDRDLSETTTPNGSSTSSLTRSADSWVQCACGERVHFLELDAHSDMHAQESISIDERELAIKDVELVTMRPPAQYPLVDVANAFDTSLPKSLRNYDQIHPSRTPPRNEKRRGPSLKDIFLGGPASPKRKSVLSAVSSKQGRTKRLGVSL